MPAKHSDQETIKEASQKLSNSFDAVDLFRNDKDKTKLRTYLSKYIKSDITRPKIVTDTAAKIEINFNNILNSTTTLIECIALADLSFEIARNNATVRSLETAFSRAANIGDRKKSTERHDYLTTIKDIEHEISLLENSLAITKSIAADAILTTIETYNNFIIDNLEAKQFIDGIKEINTLDISILIPNISASMADVFNLLSILQPFQELVKSKTEPKAGHSFGDTDRLLFLGEASEKCTNLIEGSIQAARIVSDQALEKK